MSSNTIINAALEKMGLKMAKEIGGDRLLIGENGLMDVAQEEEEYLQILREILYQ